MDGNTKTAKPRSMTAGARNVLRSNDSASLWNCTLSPGWTDEESETLRKALIKFGIGNWAKIIDSCCLPGKTNAQMNLQLQRLLGQQSTAEFAGLHIDPKMVGAKNALIQGPHIKRKNNCIVNTGGKLSREDLRKRVIQNKEEYELPEADWKDIVLPKVADPMITLEMKREDLKRLQFELEKVQECIVRIAAVHPAHMEELKLEITKSASTPSTPGTPLSDEPTIENLDIKQKGKQEDESEMEEVSEVEVEEEVLDDEEQEEEEEEEDIDMKDDSEEDADLLMAMRLQREENALAGIIDSEEEDFSDDDFSHAKKRKISSSAATKRNKVTRK